MILGTILGGFVIRKWFPRRAVEYIDLPGETVTDTVMDLDTLIVVRFEKDYDTVYVTRPDTVYVALPIQVACADALYPARYHVTSLDAAEDYYFEDPEARTALSVERLGLVEGVFSRQQKLLTYPNLGPLKAIRTQGDGVMVDFYKPPVPPKGCDFWCQAGKFGLGAVVGFGGGAIACVAVQ